MTSERALLQATPTAGPGSHWCGKADRADDAPVPGAFGAVLDVEASSEVLNEMTFGQLLAIGAVLTEVNATSGIQTQAYSTSVPTTLRKGLTKLEIAGYAAGSLVLHPMDWKDVSLARTSSNAIEHLSLQYDRPAGGSSVCPSWPPCRRPPESDMCWPAMPSWSTPTARRRGAMVGDIQHRRLREEPDPCPL